MISVGGWGEGSAWEERVSESSIMGSGKSLNNNRNGKEIKDGSISMLSRIWKISNRRNI